MTPRSTGEGPVSRDVRAPIPVLLSYLSSTRRGLNLVMCREVGDWSKTCSKLNR